MCWCVTHHAAFIQPCSSFFSLILYVVKAYLVLIATCTAGAHTRRLRSLGTDNVVDAQQQARALHGRLYALQLHGLRLPHAKLLHVDDLAGLAVDAPRVLAIGVFGL